MKKDEVKIGGIYVAKVSDRITTVRIESVNRHGGWNAVNTATGKRIRVKNAQRLRAEANGSQTTGAPAGRRSRRTPGEAVETAVATETPAAESATTEASPRKTRGRKAAEPKPKRVSALDAAAEVLHQTGKAMRAQELIAAMAEQGLWTSPGGKTPAATLYSAILREIGTKGDQARFRKVERGRFEHAIG